MRLTMSFNVGNDFRAFRLTRVGSWTLIVSVLSSEPRRNVRKQDSWLIKKKLKMCSDAWRLVKGIAFQSRLGAKSSIWSLPANDPMARTGKGVLWANWRDTGFLPASKCSLVPSLVVSLLPQRVLSTEVGGFENCSNSAQSR